MQRRRIFRIERLEPRAMLSASGDFNGDGFDDLAIGASGATISGKLNAGAVHVLYGTATGLSATGDQYWNLNSPGVNGEASYDDFFGGVLAAGDFDGDGFDDLAIGALSKGAFGETNVGTVNILYGSPTGLTATGDQHWTQNSDGVNGVAHAGDGFGGALAAGDFNNDGRDDLAIGVLGDDIPGVASAGSVNVLYGSASGLTASGDQQWSQGSAGIEGVPAAGERFGAELAVGDFNGDGRDDLAIGVFRDVVNGIFEAGSVNIIYGSGGGLTSSGDQLFNQATTGISGTPETSDEFGYAVAVGDFDGDNFDDLAIGAPSGNVGGDDNAGEVNVLYGSGAKIQVAGEHLITRDSLGGISVAGERFGAALAAGNFNGDGRDDLVIGAPSATIGGLFGVGYVQIVYGAASGLTSSGTQFIHQDSTGVLDTNQGNDGFGEAVAAGDYNNDGRDDLAIGVRGQVVGGFSSAGQVAVLLGSATGITTTGDQIWNAGSTGIDGPFQEGGSFGAAVV
jgi:hypothetical protein